MTHKLRWLAIAGLMALLAAFAAACGAERHTPQRQPTYCDLDADGVDDVQCGDDPNVTCDPLDGVCKCGATTCSEGEICVQNRCGVPDPCAGQACPEGQTCDSTDGRCKCGGEICADNESCVDGVCVDDPCKGVNCPQNSVCNPVDRACHCGTETGPVCETGQACVNEEGDWICRGARDKCEAVACSGDAVCDLDTGACCCGGTGDACVVCHKRWPRPRVRVGRLPDGSGVFACDECALALPPLHWAGTGAGAGRSLNGSARDTAPYR